MAIESTQISTPTPQPRTRHLETDGELAASRAGTRIRSAMQSRSNAGPLTQGLGWFSIGLGVAQLLAPRGMSRLAGVPGDPIALMRLFGLREVACGIGILTQRDPAPWVRARIAGDVMDLTALGLAAFSPYGRGRTTAALVTVAGVTALDVICSRELDRGMGRGALMYGIPVEHVVTINRSPEECYSFWRKLDNLPRFMQHLEAVQVTDGRLSHWVAKAPAGTKVEWDAEITEDRPNQMLAWRTLEGADVPNAGTVRFEPAPPGRGTIVRVTLQYDPPAGRLGSVVAKLFGEEPDQQVRGDLRRFKQLMETGEVPTTEGQPAGKRSAIGRMLRRGDRT
jgi:uncharacterized membrane protein